MILNIRIIMIAETPPLMLPHYIQPSTRMSDLALRGPVRAGGPDCRMANAYQHQSPLMQIMVDS